MEISLKPPSPKVLSGVPSGLRRTRPRPLRADAADQSFIVGGGDECVDFLVVVEAAGEGIEDDGDRFRAKRDEGVAHGLVGEDAGAVGAEAGGAVVGVEVGGEGGVGGDDAAGGIGDLVILVVDGHAEVFLAGDCDVAVGGGGDGINVVEEVGVERFAVGAEGGIDGAVGVEADDDGVVLLVRAAGVGAAADEAGATEEDLAVGLEGHDGGASFRAAVDVGDDLAGAVEGGVGGAVGEVACGGPLELGGAATNGDASAVVDADAEEREAGDDVPAVAEGFVDGSVGAEAVEGGVGGDDVLAVGLGGDADGGAGDVGIGEDAACARGGVEVTGVRRWRGSRGSRNDLWAVIASRWAPRKVERERINRSSGQTCGRAG